MNWRDYWRPKHGPLLTWGRGSHCAFGAIVCWLSSLAWGYAGLAVGVLAAAGFAWAWERCTYYIAPLARWKHPYGDVRDLAAYIVGALLVALLS
ncbi:MAG: hypothetical protein KC729_00180 [Candidatus Eisenbacteria bacterium]|uniref:Uncharacterized protein n=1 Tax=Eiseniibacteriota bacterium TaxID=2212470 RepID=A0A956LWW9_UNCEI|nr:hypothetical protein [Candidatus Eisenbacteria bacterium]